MANDFLGFSLRCDAPSGRSIGLRRAVPLGLSRRRARFALGGEFKGRAIVLAAAIAILGPAAWTAPHRVAPGPWMAAGFAVLFVLLLLKIGDESGYEFISFRF